MRTQGHIIRMKKGKVSDRRIMKAARKAFVTELVIRYLRPQTGIEGVKEERA